MSNAPLTIHEAAERLGVCASTLRTWGEKTGVAGSRTGSGKRLYTADDLEALAAVKGLRDQDAGWMTIRRHIGRDEPQISATPLMSETEVVAPAMSPAGEPGEGLVAKVIETLNAQSGMAERYARAGYQIGKLESEVRHMSDERARLAARLAEAEQRVAELTMNEELARTERARLGRELAELRQKQAMDEINPPGAWEKLTAWVKKYW